MATAIAVDISEPEVAAHAPTPRELPGNPTAPLERTAERHWWLGATDAGRRGLAVAAVVVPLLNRQWRQALVAAGSLALAHQACSVVKHLSSEVRPDGSDDQSFPSSHSLEAFSAATSLWMSSGMSLGAPACAAAGLVAHGRLRAGRHHLVDVLVGGAVGAASAWVIARGAGFALRERLASALTDSAGLKVR